MATDGYIKLEFFAKVGGVPLSLGVRTIYPSADSSGIETFDRTFALPCSSAIGDPTGDDDFRVAVIGYGNTATTDKITSFPGVSWQVNTSTPTETAVPQRVPLRLVPNNG